MNYFYNNIRIRRCEDCPFRCKQSREVDGVEISEYFCTPIKEKYGYTPIDETSKPNKVFCRLTNEVTEDCIIDFGQFWGKTIAEVKETAPKYIEKLVKVGAIRIVSRAPSF